MLLKMKKLIIIHYGGKFLIFTNKKTFSAYPRR